MGVPGHWRERLTSIVLATDPSLLRLRLAARAVVAVGLAAALEHLVAGPLGVPGVVAMLLGGMVGMVGSFGTSSRDRADAARTVLGIPVAATAGATPAALLHGHRVAQLVAFVAVMTVAAFVRRFGPRWFNYGMVGWQAYFFTTFVGFDVGLLGALVAIVSLAAGCLLLAAMVLPDSPQAVLRHALRAFTVQVRDLVRTAHQALADGEDHDEVARALHARSFRVVEAALLVDGYLAGGADEVGLDAAVVRHNLVDAELAAEELVRSVETLAAAGNAVSAHARALVAAVLTAVADADDAAAREAAATLSAYVSQTAADRQVEHAAALRSVADAVDPLLNGLAQCDVELPPHVQGYEPAVPLLLGYLPSAAASAKAAIEQAPADSRAARLSLNTRLCLQVAVASGITIVAADLLSPTRYYWAVLACFLVLTGTFTVGEIWVKGLSRVLGTVAGLVAATVAVHLTGHHDVRIVVVMLACVFVGLYFFRVSYAVLAFAVTTVMGELYNVLGEFTEHLLLLRLAETALGAAIAIVVALVLLPVRTTDARAAAHEAFVSAVEDLLALVCERLGEGRPSGDLFLAARRVDAALHQLALVMRPAGGATLLGLEGRRAVALIGGYTHAAYLARALAVAVAERGIAAPRVQERVEAIRTAVPAIAAR